MVGLKPTIQRLRTRCSGGIEAVLRAYANLLFSRSRGVGLLLLATTALDPATGAFGILALMVAFASARLMQLESGAVAAGAYGYNALLVGLAIGHIFSPGPWTAAVVVAGVALCMIVTASLTAAFTRMWALPVLSMPFVIVSWLVSQAVGHLGPIPLREATASLIPVDRTLGSVMVESLGCILCTPRLDAGLLVLGALLLQSRIAALLAAMACVLLSPTIFAVAAANPELVHPVFFNAAFAAMAIGGIWFVPSISSFVLALVAAAVSGLLTLGLAGPLARIGLPVSILPFNLTCAMVLCAMRLRMRDTAPESVDFLPGSPEENLIYARIRRARWRGPLGIRFRFPFRGAWICTQGVDGAITHKGLWRHGFDFEVQGTDGQLAFGAGTALEDYHCYRLPVLAAAEGTVVRVDNDVPDNAVGGVDLERNWGNLVVVHHGVGVYSLVSHLAKGSARVVVGQYVRAGEVLGLCGSSGRAPRPHLHFQLQATPFVGDATIPCQFADVILAKQEVARFVEAATPELGEVVRNPEPDAEMSQALQFTHGDTWTFRGAHGVERVVAETDYYGQLSLRSIEEKTVLYYSRTDETFTVLSVFGSSSSVLQLLRAACSRVMFEGRGNARWRDHLPLGWGRSRWGRALLDFTLPFTRSEGIEMEYLARREGATVVIEGSSVRCNRRGVPHIRTTVELVRGAGPVRVSVQVGSRHRSMIRDDAPATVVVGAQRNGALAKAHSEHRSEESHAEGLLDPGPIGELFTDSGGGGYGRSKTGLQRRGRCEEQQCRGSGEHSAHGRGGGLSEIV